MQQVAVFASAARVAEDDLDIASERKYRELVLRRVTMLSGLMVARVSVSSSRGSARCDGRSPRGCWGARRWVRIVCVGSRRRRNVCVDRRRMTRNHFFRLRATARE